MVSRGPSEIYKLVTTNWYGNYNPEKYRRYKFWHDGIGATLTNGYSTRVIDRSISETETRLYLESHGLTINDIVNPNNLPSSGTITPLADTLNFVSENINRLYNIGRIKKRGR